MPRYLFLGLLFPFSYVNATPLHLLQKACQQLERSACVELGYAYEMGKNTPIDPAKALFYYQYACEYGYGAGCYQRATLQTSTQEAPLPWFRLGCSLGDPASCYALAEYFYPRDTLRYQFYLKRACHEGITSACEP